jgi:hypothetical protein
MIDAVKTVVRPSLYSRPDGSEAGVACFSRGAQPTGAVAKRKAGEHPPVSFYSSSHVPDTGKVVCMCDWLISRLEKQWAETASHAVRRLAGEARLDLSNKHFRTSHSDFPKEYPGKAVTFRGVIGNKRSITNDSNYR